MNKSETFEAFRVEKKNGGTSFGVQELPLDSLPAGDLLIRVEYSSLNYKDALSATGNPGVTKQYPHTPGVDAIGRVVEESGGGASPFAAGDLVLVTGFDLGMDTDGGFAEYVRVPREWALPLPEKLTPREAASFGTAGLTAGLAVESLLAGGAAPEGRPILVTGATGGVGSIALGILSHLGFAVEAVSGKSDAEELLAPLAPGLTILPRETLEESADRPLLRSRWQGAVDTVGGAPLSSLLRAIEQRGTVATCGNAAGGRFESSVYPFILRGIRLVGLDSARSPLEQRREIWNRLAEVWKPPQLNRVVREISVKELPEAIEAILHGRHRGRTIIKIS